MLHPETPSVEPTPQIEGLEDFSFTNMPLEELELKGQFDNFIKQM